MGTETKLTTEQIENRKEACKTFVEQTKLLTSLASAFIVAPAAVQAFIQLKINSQIIFAEVAFILSVLSSYVVLGAIAGSQHDGQFNVYRPAVKWSALFQFFAYVIGLVLFVLWLSSQSKIPV